MNARPPPRLNVFLARDVEKAVVLRRGPAEHVQLISWDTATDRFDEGQWFKGRVYEQRCDLSPDGTYLVYFAAHRNRARMKAKKDTWTAISRPPFFTALAIWFFGDTWHGGGVFDSPSLLRLHGSSGERDHPEDRVDPGCPLSFGVLSERDFGDTPVIQARCARDGWVLRSPPPADGLWGNWFVASDKQGPIVWERVRHGFTLRQTLRAGLPGPAYEILESPVDLADATWADWDHSGRLLFAARGCLYAAAAPPLGAWKVEQLADFGANTFTQVPPTAEALRW